MKNIIKGILLLSSAALFIMTGINAVSSGTKAANFPVYSVRGERFVFYKIIDSMPDDGIIIVNFTSVNCLPCKKEIPELKKITGSGNGRLKLMCIYAESADLAGRSAESLGATADSYVDPFGNIQKMYNIAKYPVTIIVDKKHRILGRFDGYTSDNIKKIKKICGN